MQIKDTSQASDGKVHNLSGASCKVWLLFAIDMSVSRIVFLTSSSLGAVYLSKITANIAK